MRIQKTAKGEYTVTLTARDRRRLHKIIKVLGPSVQVETSGQHEQFDDAEWWLRLVSQVCVMGGSRGWERASANPAFKTAITLKRCLAAPDPGSYLATVLREHGATRFWQKAADALAGALANRGVVRGRRFVLCEGLTRLTPRDQIREALVARSSLFKMKSASDFMIGAGLSHDVIAFDARVVGLLREAFDLNATAGQVQGNGQLYLALESALRDVCSEIGSSLAVLDRVIYKFRGKSEMSKVLK